jgi:hypothetical protein
MKAHKLGALAGAFVSLIVALMFIQWKVPDHISGGLIQNPNWLKWSLAVFCSAYATWMITTLLRKHNIPGWLPVVAASVWFLSGISSCQAIQHRTPKSVTVNDPRGTYQRRPPGMKQYDDRLNRKTGWFGFSVMGAMLFGVFYRFLACEADGIFDPNKDVEQGADPNRDAR